LAFLTHSNTSTRNKYLNGITTTQSLILDASKICQNYDKVDQIDFVSIEKKLSNLEKLVDEMDHYTSTFI